MTQNYAVFTDQQKCHGKQQTKDWLPGPLSVPWFGTKTSSGYLKKKLISGLKCSEQHRALTEALGMGKEKLPSFSKASKIGLFVCCRAGVYHPADAVFISCPAVCNSGWGKVGSCRYLRVKFTIACTEFTSGWAITVYLLKSDLFVCFQWSVQAEVLKNICFVLGREKLRKLEWERSFFALQIPNYPPPGWRDKPKFIFISFLL